MGLACEEAPSGVRLEVVRGEIPDGWDSLVQQDPAAGFFQTSAWWRSALSGWRGGRPLAVVAYRGEDLVGGVAAVERGRGPLRRIDALPMGTHGGPVIARGAPGGWSAEEDDRWPWLDDESSSWRRGTRLGGALALGLMEAGRAGEMHLVDAGAAAGERLALVPGMFCDFVVHRVVDLTVPEGELWEAVAPACRNKVRRAERAGLRAERSADGAIALGWIREVGRAAAEERGFRSNVPVPLLEALAGESGGPGSVEGWCAKDGEGEPVAAILNLVQGGRVTNYMAAACDAGRRGAAHNLLHWSALADAAARSLSVYDFGASPGLPEVDRFKASFGARELRVRAWRLRSPMMRLLRWAAGRSTR